MIVLSLARRRRRMDYRHPGEGDASPQRAHTHTRFLPLEQRSRETRVRADGFSRADAVAPELTLGRERG